MRDFSKTQSSFDDSFEYISSFFGGDIELIEAFNAVCRDMLSLDGELVIRHNSTIIGMAKGNQYYRFYLRCIDGEFFIKYKHLSKLLLFSPENTETYFLKNRENYEFFVQNGELLVRGDAKTKDCKRKTVDLDEEWGELRAIANNFSQSAASTKVIYNIYTSILALLSEAAESCLNPRKLEVLKKRILTNSPEALRDMASRFNISPERIRQLQNSSWRRVSTGIYMYVRFSSYREQLKNILLNVPSEMLVSTIEGITLINKPIGEWLSVIVVGDNQN